MGPNSHPLEVEARGLPPPLIAVTRYNYVNRLFGSFHISIYGLPHKLVPSTDLYFEVQGFLISLHEVGVCCDWQLNEEAEMNSFIQYLTINTNPMHFLSRIWTHKTSLMR